MPGSCETSNISDTVDSVFVSYASTDMRSPLNLQTTLPIHGINNDFSGVGAPKFTSVKQIVLRVHRKCTWQRNIFSGVDAP